MVKIYVLPAGVGDFIWVRFGEGTQTKYNILIDGGHEKYSIWYRQILTKIASEKQTALIIMTHIDADHIQGAAQGIADLPEELLRHTIDRVIFNTGIGIRRALHNASISSKECLCRMPEDQVIVYGNSLKHSVRDAETFLNMINRKRLTSKIVDYIISGMEIDYGGAHLRFISPGENELEKLLERWEEYNSKHGIHYYTSTKAHDTEHISSLMNEKLGYDRSVTNRSSLAFLFEYEDTKGAFLGDAAATVMCSGLKNLNIRKPYVLDFIKLPHHGGKYNMSDQLLRILPTQNYIISTEGVPESSVPSKILIAHIIKIAKEISIPADTYCTANERKVRLYNNYSWWTATYSDRFFTDDDRINYIDTGLLELVLLSNRAVEIHEGLELYRLF